ncbi:hypothetical protein D9M68_802590 [compost metagenome]
MAMAQVLGGDGGVVQVAEAAGGVVPRVVARRTAQGVGLAAVIEQGASPGDGALRRPVGGAPGLFAHRAAAVGQVARGLGKDAAQRVGLADEHVGHHLVAPVLSGGQPLVMGLLEEAQVLGAVHSLQRLHAEVRRTVQFEAEALDRLQQAPRAFGNLLRGAHLSAREVAARVVQVLVGVEVGQHRSALSECRFPAISG